MTLPTWDGTRWVPAGEAALERHMAFVASLPRSITDSLAPEYSRRTLVGRVVRWARALELDGPSWGTVVVVRQHRTHGEVVHRSPFNCAPRAAEHRALEATA